MKKFMYLFTILVLVLSLTLFGCKKDDGELLTDNGDSLDEVEGNEEDNDDEPKTSEEIVNKFNEILENKVETKELVSFIDKNIKNVTSIEADQMITGLINKLEKSKEDLMESLTKLDNGKLVKLSSQEYFPEDKIEDIKDKKLKKLVKELIDNNYKLELSGDKYYPIIDYENIKKYNDYVSAEVADYIKLKAMDSNQVIISDDALVISFDDLVKLIIKTEEYLEKYAGGKYHKEVEKMYENKLNTYLSGLPNSLIYDKDTRKIKKDVLDSYVNTASTGDSVTAFISGKYVNVIGENKKIIDKDVFKNADLLVEEALTLLVNAK